MTTPANTQADLDMVYEGSSLSDRSMNVRDLAPALLAVGNFFDEANRIANGEQATISVNVRATSPGSFHIVFEVIQNIGSTGILQAGIGDFISAAADLKDLLVGGGSVSVIGGLIWLIKKLNGRSPRVQKMNDDLYRLIVSDSETYEIPLRLLRLYQDIAIRRNIESMVRPLDEIGIDKLSFREGGRTIQEVAKADVPAFAIPESKEKIIDEINQRALSIVGLVFKEDNKWRLSDGQNEFSALIRDEEFLEQIDRSAVSFSKRDILVCRLRTIQWRSNTGLSTEYEVVKVVDHHQARQLPLGLEAPEEED